MTSYQLLPLFPSQTTSYILSFQFSSWYPHFSFLSIKSIVVRPLSQEFRDYLDADGIVIPEGSENIQTRNSPPDDDDIHDGEEEEVLPTIAFPEMDTAIRACVEDYGAVFPKLNFSSPKDASWMLSPSTPLKCTSPADVYLLLKSSDFVAHDLSVSTVFEGCTGTFPPYELELVLRKWYPFNRSREIRCFVRQNVFIALSGRDNNNYDFLNDLETRDRIRLALQEYWEKYLRDAPYLVTLQDYIFDFLLTRDLTRGHIIDFNPYAPRTDPLCWTYEELAEILRSRLDSVVKVELPEFRVIDSPTHPTASRNAPQQQHNMVPLDALMYSSGRNLKQFTEDWKNEIFNNMTGTRRASPM